MTNSEAQALPASSALRASARSGVSQEAVSWAISVHLKEFEVMRAELLQVQGAQGQLVLYALISLAAAIPILAWLLQNRIWQSLLVVPLVFSSMGLAYAGYMGMSYRISIYINSFLRPQIMELLSQQMPGQAANVLYWEQFAQARTLFMLTLPKGFEVLAFVLPSMGSMLLYLAIKNFSRFTLISIEWAALAFDTVLIAGFVASIIGVLSVGGRRLAVDN